MDNNKWTLIICDKDLNVRVGEHNDPEIISYKEIEFNTKDELLKEYNKQINKYMKKSYDWKGHSQGAIKFYYSKGKDDILTQLLVYHDGDEVMEGLFE